MKHVSCILLFALLVWGQGHLQAGCPAKTINGQTQLDEYVSSLGSCTTVDGALILSGNIDDLSGLDPIIEVQGDLILSGLTTGSLYNIFSSLTTVGGELRISNNDNLGNISHGFVNLTSIGGDFRIFDNDALFIVDGFTMLSSIGGDFSILSNHLLASIPIFEKLESVGNLTISFNDLLGEVNGFQYLKTIDGNLIFDANGILKSILGFSRLEVIDGDLSFIDNSALVEIGTFGSLLQVQNLTLNGNTNLEQFGGFDYLQSAEQINVNVNPSLVTFEGFARLTTVNDHIDIYDNDELLYLNAFGALHTVGGSFYVMDNLKLPTISGFGQLEEIGTSLVVRNNAALQQISGFGALLSIGDVLEISSNPMLENLYAFSLLTTIGSVLEISGNYLRLIDFPRLQSIGSTLMIEFENNLEKLVGFSRLNTVGGEFLVRNNQSLKEVGGFGNLNYVDGLFEISNNPSLLSIEGFGRVTSMGLDLIIQDNLSLRYIKGFSSLRTLGDDLRVRDNLVLESIFAFEILESIQMLEVFNNPQLFYCCGIGYLIQVTGYTSLNIASNSEGCNSPAEIDAACNATLSDCTPNCIGFINASLDRYGIATIYPKDFVSDTLACMTGVEVTVEDRLGAIVFGPKVVGLNGAIPIKACNVLRKQPLKVTTRGAGGACWSELTFKQTSVPTVQQDTAVTVLCGDPLATEPLSGTAKTAWIPCQPELQADWVTDWVTAFDCVPGIQDTVKIIYREWEAYDKEGNRGVSFDTIYVLQFPEILPENIYCEQKDTVFCADTTALIGPYITYNDPLNGCQQTYLVSAADKNNDGTLEFIPKVFDTKCGLTVHVDYKKFPGDCENNYRVTVDIKQHCYGMGDPMTCVVPIPAGTLPNAAEQIDTGYWRCEFWVVDLDTLAPELVCKGTDLFSGPFDIGRFGLYDDFFGAAPTPAGLPAIAAGAPLEEISTFDLSKLPYALSIRSRENPIVGVEEARSNDHSVGANGFFPARFFSNAVMSYEAEDDQTFSFSWDFTMATQQDDMVIPATVEALPANGPAVASVFYSLNGSSFRLLEGEPIDNMVSQQVSGNRSSALISTQAFNMIDPVAVSGSQYGFNHIPLTKGDILYIIAVWDAPVDATFRIMGLNQVSTSKTECIAHSYIPPIEAMDDWSGVKQAKASIEDIGSFQLSFDEVENCWVSHERVRLPYQKDPYKIYYEVFDSCHNVGYDSCYLYVKDLIKPVPVIDKGFTVSLGDKKVWVDREAFDEGSFDNCELNFFLIRRADWFENCVDLCDSLEPICITEHHDTIWRPVLELDKRVAEVEAHYAKTLGWIKNESEACGELLYNAWQYDLMKYATMHCKKSYDLPLTEDGFSALIDSCAYALQPYFAGVPFHADDDRYQRKLSQDLIDQYAQIGGGWSDQVVFSCEDACGPVTIEVLVMDYWCNWSTAWTTVWVEDKVAPQVVKEVVENTISCKTYKEKNIVYQGASHLISIEEIVLKGKEGDTVALAHLDEIFGGYQKAWVDPYGRYVDLNGDTIACDISLYDSICRCTTDTVSIRVYDDHLGYVWKDSVVSNCFYELAEKDFQQGIVKVNCNQNVYCEQQVWCDFDHCGEGFIQRKFKIWQSCPSDFYTDGNVPDSIKHPVDTIYRQQRIWVGNECDLNKYMFEVPRDTTIFACGVSYDDQGNVIGDASPTNIGRAKYKFDDDCRLVGIAHQDKAFKIIGGGYDACYKILRTWYFADWCGYGESTDPYWWSDYDLVLDSCVQVIFVRDTTAPVCRIEGPVASGGTFEVGTCDYDLNVNVEMEDLCGIASYEWQLYDIADGAYTLVSAGEGQWTGMEQSTFKISVEGLAFSTYKLELEIIDECRNKAYCDYEITLQSVKKPTPICITSLTARLTPWDLDNDGIADTALAVLWAEEFDQSSKPACGDDYLEFRLDVLDGDDDDAFAGDADSLLLGCDQVGAELVRLWVISQPSGTADYCDVVVVTQSDFDGCTPSPVSPTIRSEIPAERVVRHTTKKGENSGIVLNIPRDTKHTEDHIEDDFYLGQNRPNPFIDEAVIDFVLPVAVPVQINFYDLTGRMLKSIQGNYTKGRHSLTITQDDMGAHGMIYYHIQAGDYSATRKMLALP